MFNNFCIYEYIKNSLSAACQGRILIPSFPSLKFPSTEWAGLIANLEISLKFG